MGTPTHHHTKPHTEHVSTHTYNTHICTYVCTYLSCIFGQVLFSIFQYKLTNGALNVTPGLRSSACCTTKPKFLCRKIEQTNTLTTAVQSSVRYTSQLLPPFIAPCPTTSHQTPLCYHKLDTQQTHQQTQFLRCNLTTLLYAIDHHIRAYTHLTNLIRRKIGFNELDEFISEFVHQVLALCAQGQSISHWLPQPHTANASVFK